jgi:V8-like Glu-specific endopeptidase
VGLLRVNWFNKLGKLVCVNYGTAFAVNSKMVVTCIHNIYSENGRELCQEVTFIPGIAKGFINDSHHQYKCTEAARMKCQIPKETLSYTPLKEELVILALDDGF